MRDGARSGWERSLVAGGAATVPGVRCEVMDGNSGVVWAREIQAQAAEIVTDLAAASASRDMRVDPRVLSVQREQGIKLLYVFR